MKSNGRSIQTIYRAPRAARSEKGFTLIEVLISLAIFSVGILGLITSIGSVIDYQRDADDITQATLLTKERIEMIKAVSANENALAGGTYNFNYLISGFPATIGLTAVGNSTYNNAGAPETIGKFTRTTDISVAPTAWDNGDFTVANQPNVRFVVVTVSVTWTASRGSVKTNTLSVVLNRREILQQ